MASDEARRLEKNRKSREYYAQNIEQERARRREDYCPISASAYYQANRERYARYYQDNRERLIAKARDRYRRLKAEAEPEADRKAKDRARKARHYQANKERLKAKARARYHQKKEGDHVE